MDKNELLRQMFLEYWQWDVDPELDNPPANSPEAFVLSMYDEKKSMALSKYPWRSAISYVELTGTEPEVSKDGHYKYEVKVPDNFLMATGFWRDFKRTQDCHNSVDIVGKTARTNLPKFTMGYVNKDVDEDDLDPWVCDYIKIVIASELSDIGGQTPDRKNYLMQKAEADLITCGNKDFEMAHHDEVSSSIHQFEWY